MTEANRLLIEAIDGADTPDVQIMLAAFLGCSIESEHPEIAEKLDALCCCFAREEFEEVHNYLLSTKGGLERSTAHYMRRHFMAGGDFMTPNEKRSATYERKRAAAAQRAAEREATIKALREVRDNPEALPADRLRAVELLKEYHA